MARLLTLAAVAFVTFVSTFSVWILLADRMERQADSSAEVAGQWGRAQLIAGPVLSIPVERATLGQNGVRTTYRETLYLLPKKLSYEGSLVTEIRTRGIYDTPVYTAHVKGAGTFDFRDITFMPSADQKLLWNEAVLSVHVADTRGIPSLIELSWQGAEVPFAPSSRFTPLGESGVHSPVPVSTNVSEYSFSFETDLRGSDSIAFLPLGEATEVALTSDWSSPNFDGNFLPESRSVSESGFEASWKVASYGRNLPQSWVGEAEQVANTESLKATSFGVRFHNEVDFYTLVDRTTKYSILFIALTFLSFFMFEMFAGLRIHPVQYLLIGFAIALFYLLLLSFAELIGFVYAYILGAAAVTLLITGYAANVLKAKRRAGIIAVLLLALYTYLYVLLQLEELALVFGSVLLFVVLAVVMFITRHFDWYSLSEQKKF